MSSSRVVVGFALAISLLALTDWSAAQPAPPGGGTPPANGVMPPPAAITPIRSVPKLSDPKPPDQIADSIKLAGTPASTDIGQIDGAVAAVCAMMADADHPATQSACRDWLIQGLSDSKGNPASIGYLQVYAQFVNQHLLDQVKAPSAGIRLKIEAGIVAAKTADASMSTVLMPLAVQLMRDPSPAVVLGGIKTATPVLPAMMDSPLMAAKAPGFAREIAGAAMRTSSSLLQGRIISSAYTALEPLYTYGPRFAGLAPKIVTMLVPVILDMEQQRIQLYRKQPPVAPQEDANGLIILFDQNIWSGANGVGGLAPAVQAQVLQAFSDLVGVSAEWAENPSPAATSVHSRLVDSLRTLGRILNVFSDPNNGVSPDAKMFVAGGSLQGLAPGAPASQIDDFKSQMVDAITVFAKGKFGTDINPPPLLDNGQ